MADVGDIRVNIFMDRGSYSKDHTQISINIRIINVGSSPVLIEKNMIMGYNLIISLTSPSNKTLSSRQHDPRPSSPAIIYRELDEEYHGRFNLKDLRWNSDPWGRSGEFLIQAEYIVHWFDRTGPYNVMRENRFPSNIIPFNII
ncbi:MAG: hypothetical protein ACMUHY_06450 [Thermoplasmatota archaeon]